MTSGDYFISFLSMEELILPKYPLFDLKTLENVNVKYIRFNDEKSIKQENGSFTYKLFDKWKDIPNNTWHIFTVQ